MRREGLVEPDEAEPPGSGAAGAAEPGEDAPARPSEPRSPLPAAVVVAGCPIEDVATVAVSGASIDGPGSFPPVFPSEPMPEAAPASADPAPAAIPKPGPPATSEPAPGPTPGADGASAGPGAYDWLAEFGSFGGGVAGGSLLTVEPESGPEVRGEAGVRTAVGPGSASGTAVGAATSDPSAVATSDPSGAVVADWSGAAIGSEPVDGDGPGVAGDADSPVPGRDADALWLAGVAGETEVGVGGEAAAGGASGGGGEGAPMASSAVEDAGRPEAARSPTPSASAGGAAP